MTDDFSFTLREVAVDPTATEPDADIIAATRVRNDAYAAATGSRDEDASAQTYLQTFTGHTQIHRLWAVEAGEQVVAIARLDVPLDPGATSAHGEILVDTEWWGRGIGSACLDALEAATRSLGRTTLIGWAEHPSDDALPSLAAPTGFGSVPRDHIARFLMARGYALQQVERKSVLDLDADIADVAAMRDRAASVAVGYEVLSWVGRTPDELTDGMARLRNRMSVDVPSGELDMTEQAWDAARIRQNDDRVAAGGTVRSTTVARHVDSADLVAYTVLYREQAPGAATEQDDTLVHGDHRGHRLGMLVKCEALLRWREANPDSPRILTWNAEENRPMLSINEEMGFVPAGYIGAWQKRFSREEDSA